MKMKMRPVWFVASLFCVGMVIVGGCAHPLTIKNMSNYQTFGIASFEKPVKIGLVADTTEVEEKVLLNAVANSLGMYSAQVIMPYHPNSQRKVDVIAHLDIDSQHKGAGVNFLINWPGFLVFAPAWNGYVYKVNWTVNCTVMNGSNKEIVDQFEIPITLDVRHAAMNRTWTEVSWFEIGAIAFFSGIAFTNYDNSVTPLVVEKTENQLGKYIAQEIVKRINAHGGFTQIRLSTGELQLAIPADASPPPHG